MAKPKTKAGAAPEAAPSEQPPAPRSSGFLGGFISKPVLFLGLVVGLVSFAVDYIEAPIEPAEFQLDFAPRTLEQKLRYDAGVGRVPNSLVFESAERVLDGQMLAPEDIVISPDGKKAFTGLRDGRVVYFTSDDKSGKVEMHELGRTGNYEPSCGELASETICGRPLGLAFVDGAAYHRYVGRMEDPTFFPKSTMLLVADAYKGLILMDANGKKTKVFDTVGPRRTKFLNALAVTKEGQVYLTESSRRFFRREVTLDVLERQFTGRLLHFNPVTTRVSILAKDLAFPNGLTLADDEKTLIVAMMFQNKLVKFDLKTRKFEDFAFLPGMPDNVHLTKNKNGKQELFVGLVSIQPSWLPTVAGPQKIRKLVSLVLPPKVVRDLVCRRGAFVRVDATSGDVTHVYEDREGAARFLSGVVEFGDYYYVTSWVQDFLLRIPKKVIG